MNSTTSLWLYFLSIFFISILADSLINPYRPQDGIINAGDEYFAWLAAVPNGEVEGFVTIDGVKKEIKGNN